MGVADKSEVVRDILERHGIAPAAACFIGDDLIDLPAMGEVGLPIAVADAVGAVQEAAVHVTERPGGHGAFREVVDLLLAARDQ